MCVHLYDCNLEVSILLVSLDFKTLWKMFTQRGKYVAGMSFMAFHFMLDLLSHMNDKDKQQVCNDISISVWEFYKITMRISQLSRNIHRENITFYFGLKWLDIFGF